MEKRVLLAISLSFLVLFAYQMLVPKPAPKPAGARPGTSASQTPGVVPGTASAAGANAATGADASQPIEAGSRNGAALERDTPAAAATAAKLGDTAEREIVVDTNHVRAVFSNRGALLKSWTLKHYLDEQGKPIDITPPVTANPAMRPFAISVQDATVTQTVQTALYKPSATALQLGDTSQTLRFDYEDANGLLVKKEFEFQPDKPYKPYVVRVNISVTQNGQPLKVTVHGGAGLGDLERAVKPAGFFHPSNYQQPEGIFQLAHDVTRIPLTKLPQQPVHEGAFRYVGVDDHYFLGAYLAGDTPTRVEYTPVSVITSAGPRDLVDYRVQPAGGLPNGPLTFFYGPKDFDILKSTDQELVRSIYFGMFSFLAVPLLRALKWINAYIGNFGWSIILLTVGINLILFPLRHKSVVSMRRMQEIQPQIKAIQDRYAKLKVTDPARQKMNTEMMNLYREKGVNPASGCVPMLMTLPVLFAFYALLSVAIELRGAPFTLWIHDLSRYDPYFVTPVLMGITQFWQTRLTPTTGDPAQQRMMMFMPLMFMVFFVWAPSGLVIYWFVSNLWSIGQQYLTNQLIGPPPQHVLRPTAERRVKRA
jgi:YidC/Oxa1 family membrane protein insertase